MRSHPVGRDGWCHLPLRVAYEVLTALVDEADRRYLSPSRLVEQVLRERLPQLAAERVAHAVRVVPSDHALDLATDVSADASAVCAPPEQGAGP